jgi:hypothetical protein
LLLLLTIAVGVLVAVLFLRRKSRTEDDDVPPD